MSGTNYDLLDRIRDVSNATADANDLLTLSVPADGSVGDALERVEEAHADAEYIHADETSRARREVLERARHLLHGYDATPENGLALYVGEVDDEVVEYVFDDLPAPVDEWTFDWSNSFDAGPVEATTGSQRVYGLLVVERGGAALGRLDGERVEPIETMDSDVMGKTKAGGQSADRFERDRERQKREFFDEVADEAERAFLGDDPVDGLLLGGTAVTVDEFREGEFLDHRLRDLLVGGSFSVEYASEQGLRGLVERAEDAIEDEERRPVREVLDRFFDALDDDEVEVAYGREEVETALEYDAVETLLVSDDLPIEEIRDLEERVDREGGDVVVVPTDLQRGAQFREAFGGVGALLRFAID